jgi:hypothetical protein
MGVQISGDTGNVLATKGTYTGNLTVGGVLTYEDVTNVDSVGLVTARTGIEIGARPGVAASISVDGNAIFSGITTFGGSGTGGSGTSTLTYDGNNLSQSIDAAAEGIQITGSGAHYGEISIDSNRTSSNQHVGTIKGSWNGTQVARIAFNTGSDTTNKDDGRILFSTSASGGTLANRAVIKEDGSIQLTSENTTGWLLDAGDDSASYTAIDNHFPTTNRTLYLNAETTHRSIAFWNKNGSDGYGFGLDNSGNFKVVYGTSERIRINSSGKVLIGDDTPENTIGLNARVQTFGTDASTSGVAIRRGSNDAQAAFLVMSKSRNASVGSRTIVNNGDEVGNIFFAADDGTDLVSNTAAIKSQVDGAPGANDTPGNLSFWTTPDGSNTATQKMTISNAGLMTVTKQYFLVVDLSSDISGYNATGTTHVLFNRIQQENKDASLSSCFDTSTGLFTAPVAGLYFLEAAVYSTSASFGQSWFVVSGARKSFTDEVMTGGAGFTHNHTILRLAANETVGYLAYSSSGSSVNIRSNANHTYMKIALIC